MMAVLPDADRKAAWAQFMRDLDRLGIVTSLTKPELRDLFDAADDWLEADKLRYNQSIPLAIRTKASATEKAYVLSAVALRRALKGA